MNILPMEKCFDIWKAQYYEINPNKISISQFNQLPTNELPSLNIISFKLLTMERIEDMKTFHNE